MSAGRINHQLLFTTDSEFFSLLPSDTRHVNSYAHIDIAQFSSWLSYIGTNDDHTIIYTTDSINSGFCYCFSKPKRVKATSLYFLANNDNYQIEPLTATQALKNIKYCFWAFEGNDQNVEQQNNFELYLQLRSLQRKLPIEKGIVWLFSLRR